MSRDNGDRANCGNDDGAPSDNPDVRTEIGRLRKQFGKRLKGLLETAGMSSREFGRRYPAYAQTIRTYTSGSTMPPLNVVEALLEEVDRRADLAPQAYQALSAHTLNDYRSLLAKLGTPGGSNQNSLLLRVYDLEMELRAVTHELAQVRERETDLLTRHEGQEHQPHGRLEEQLQTKAMELAARRDQLVRRRRAAVRELDECQERYLQIVQQDESDGHSGAPQRDDDRQILGAGHGGEDPHHRPDMRKTGDTAGGADPHQPPGRRRAACAMAVAGGALAVVLLLAAGIWVGMHYTDSTTPEAKGKDDQTGAASPSTARKAQESATASASASASSTPTVRSSAPVSVSGLPYAEGSSELQPGSFRMDGREYADSLSEGCGLATERLGGGTEYALKGQYTKFTATLGVTAGPDDADAVGTFGVLVDGKRAGSWTATRDRLVQIAIDVKGAERLTLQSADLVGDPLYCKVDRFVWGNPRLIPQ
ncbi:NPCBM/NEW2 domain-containing protein [Streptomyces sp. NPDC048484]|uniref:NPCBM/NEW2 domain-containing protein n=1 Tax=Streptomyces sp. NPDC048484 TaxID=3155146 RepID=UPI00342FA0DE